jgi:hypothetical protein
VEQRMTKATGAEDHRISLFVDPLAGKAHAGRWARPACSGLSNCDQTVPTCYRRARYSWHSLTIVARVY